MDIASASNFERFMFDQVDRDPQRLKKLWEELSTKGEFSWNIQNEPNSTVRFRSGTATDDEVTKTIKLIFDRTGLIIDPHTAVAAKVFYDRQGSFNKGPSLIAETAQPAKFEDAIERALGFKMMIPEAYRHLEGSDERIIRINETDSVAIANTAKAIIEANVRK